MQQGPFGNTDDLTFDSDAAKQHSGIQVQIQ
jgi:hypothetical protein